MSSRDSLAEVRSHRRLTLDEAAALHGHKGPWLVIGYRAGERAVEVLKPSTEMDLSCTARSPLRTPYTCALDGIQASAKCTLGKLNIKVEESDHIEFSFANVRDGRVLRLKLKPEVPETIERISERSVAEAAKWVEVQPLCNLFEEEIS